MKYTKFIFIILTIACILFIWYHSSLNGHESTIESQGALNIVKLVLSALGMPDNVSEFALRKFAHFLEFSGLGFLLTCDLYLWFSKPVRYITLPHFVGLLVGCVDETIQIFSPGRSSKVTDVWVDFSGIIVSIIITVILINLIFKINIYGYNKKNCS